MAKYNVSATMVASGIGWLLSLTLASQALAAPLMPLTYDLTVVGSESNAGNPGNTFSYTNSGYTIELSGWSNTGSGNLDIATLIHDSDPALGYGVCNSAELPLNDCLTKGGGKDRLIDNKSEEDWVLIVLPENMTINSFGVATNANDLRSVTYYTGRVDTRNDIAGQTYAELVGFDFGLGFDAAVNDSQGKATGAATFSLSHSGFRNALLVGASLQDANAEFTLTQLDVTTVPLPAGVWLFGSAIAFLAGRRKLSAK